MTKYHNDSPNSCLCFCHAQLCHGMGAPKKECRCCSPCIWCHEDQIKELSLHQKTCPKVPAWVKFTKEELEVLEKRKKNQAVREQMLNGLGPSSSLEEIRKVVNKIQELDGDLCEHGRSWWSGCIACHELEIKLGNTDE